MVSMHARKAPWKNKHHQRHDIIRVFATLITEIKTD